MQMALSILFYVLFWSGLVAVDSGQQSHRFAYGDSQAHVDCLTCHHPHRPPGEVPRWQVATEEHRRFSLYKTRPELPSESSLLCLTCHDGAIAEEIHLGDGQGAVSQVARSTAILDGRIRFPLGSHPVGIRYDEHNSQLHPKATVEADRLVRLPENRVECVSCHDPHGTEGHKYMLVKSNRRSALCLSCHRL